MVGTWALTARKISSAPSSVADGTLVADGTTAASVADLPGAGTWFYGAAAKYDEGSGTRYSGDLVTDSIVVP